MDRKAACLLQASAYFAKAEADPLDCQRWTEEARKWLALATAPSCAVVVTIERTVAARDQPTQARASLR